MLNEFLAHAGVYKDDKKSSFVKKYVDERIIYRLNLNENENNSDWLQKKKKGSSLYTKTLFSAAKLCMLMIPKFMLLGVIWRKWMDKELDSFAFIDEIKYYHN